MQQYIGCPPKQLEEWRNGIWVCWPNAPYTVWRGRMKSSWGGGEWSDLINPRVLLQTRWITVYLNVNGARGIAVVDWMMMQTGGAGMSHPASAVSQHEKRVKSPHPCLKTLSPSSWKDLPLCIFIRPWFQLRTCTHNGKDGDTGSLSLCVH